MLRAEVLRITAKIPLTLRHATASDVDAIAEMFSASLGLLTFLPNLHTVAEDRSFIANTILGDCEVAVGEPHASLIGRLHREAWRV